MKEEFKQYIFHWLFSTLVILVLWYFFPETTTFQLITSWLAFMIYLKV